VTCAGAMLDPRRASHLSPQTAAALENDRQ
jgi:hypothetical protein